MSAKERLISYRELSDWFLRLFAVSVSVMGKDNWSQLTEDTHTDGVTPFLTGLTHKDYLDAPAIWRAIADDETILQFIVMSEGFSGGIRALRNIIANLMAPTLPLSRQHTSKEEIKQIQQVGNSNSAAVLYLSGNRNLVSPLKPGFQLMMQNQDVMYPFINLSDTAPVFPSGSSFQGNVREFLQRSILRRESSTEFLYLLKPILKADLEKMKEGKKKGKEARAEVMEKLEVIRAYGVLKTIAEIVSAQHLVLNPVYSNPDNIPLVLKSQRVLEENSERVNWLTQQGYFEAGEVQLLLSIPQPNE